LLADAAALQAQYPDPTTRPPLYGIPLGVKDIFRADGFLTHSGWKLPTDLFDGPETACVTKLRQAGVLILGKTVTTEFAYFQPGPTRNPHDPDHTPGGSSSGSAAAVAAGFCPLALGTQTVGSVNRPAAYCGVVGFKPTYNRIDPTGLLFISRSLDHVGLFTQDVAGMTLAAGALCEAWQPEKVSTEGRLPVLGLPQGAYLEQATPEGLADFEAQLIRLEEAGYIIKQVPLLSDIEAITQYHFRLMAAEMAENHRNWFREYEALYHQQTADLIRDGQTVPRDEIRAAQVMQLKVRATLERVMTDLGIDIWVSPAAPGPAPAGIQATCSPAMNLPWTHAGLPALSLPAGRAANGLPLGLQGVGRFMGDEQLLAWAEPMAEILQTRLAPATS
jgi:Asp-tRNA(Asn)/Glu-tRNA(Gln) amidotransferase A subunit family amidase